jgi:hypothetical protein
MFNPIELLGLVGQHRQMMQQYQQNGINPQQQIQQMLNNGQINQSQLQQAQQIANMFYGKH